MTTTYRLKFNHPSFKQKTLTVDNGALNEQQTNQITKLLVTQFMNRYIHRKEIAIPRYRFDIQGKTIYVYMDELVKK